MGMATGTVQTGQLGAKVTPLGEHLKREILTNNDQISVLLSRLESICNRLGGASHPRPDVHQDKPSPERETFFDGALVSLTRQRLMIEGIEACVNEIDGKF